MTDMTPEARAAMEFPCDCGNVTEFHSQSCQSRWQPALIVIIRQAEAAARRKALDDAEEVANTFYYGNDIKAAIRELNGKSGNKEIAEWNEHDTIYI